MNSYAVIFSYSVDHDVAVYLFDTEEEAKEFLSDSVLSMFLEEAGHQECGLSYDISEDGLFGTVKYHYLDGIDTVEVRVGRVYL